MLSALSKVVFRQHGHWNRLDLTEHFTLQRHMALLDISGDIWAECTPFRHLPYNHNLALRPLPEDLPSHDHPSYPIAFPRHFPNGFCHDY